MHNQLPPHHLRSLVISDASIPAGDPLSEAQKQAGATILRNWRNFAAQRNNAPDVARGLARAMGEQVIGDNYKAFLEEGRIVVQINGASGDSTRGHSVIYHGCMRHELLLTHETDPNNPNISRYGMSEQAARYFNEKFQAPVYDAGSHSRVARDIHFNPNLMDASSRGNLFALHKRFSQNLNEALRLTMLQFHLGPYSWGLNYNCNVFMFKFLQKLRELTR